MIAPACHGASSAKAGPFSHDFDAVGGRSLRAAFRLPLIHPLTEEEP
jgi:hypothetical protein